MITLENESGCAGCGGSCPHPPESPLVEAPPLSGRSVVLGSMAFFLGPVLLAIAAATVFNSNGAIQFAAATVGLVAGMALAWLAGKAFGFSPKESE